MEFQSCRDFFQQFEDFGFRMNWVLLKMGYEGARNLPPVLSSNTIIQYAEECLETEISEYDLLVSLIDSSNENDFHILLDRIANSEKTDAQLQYRKLRLYIVHCTIDSLPADYFDGLMELTELWISLGMPQDCPVFIQGYNNSFTPQEYYKKSTYDSVLSKIKEWIKPANKKSSPKQDLTKENIAGSR